MVSEERRSEWPPSLTASLLMIVLGVGGAYAIWSAYERVNSVPLEGLVNWIPLAIGLLGVILAFVGAWGAFSAAYRAPRKDPRRH